MQDPEAAEQPEERRTFRRAPLRVPALVDAGSSWQKCESINVSAGGLAVRTDQPLAAGTIVDLYFELPFSVAIETRARVVWWEKGVLALAFEGLERQSQVALRAFCRVSTTVRVPSVASSGPGSSARRP